MIEAALRKRLRPIVKRRRRLHLAYFLSACWIVAALLGIGLICVNRYWGWKSPVANWALCISTALATLYALYRYHRMQPDYKAVAQHIERQHPDMQALLLAAIEQEPEGSDGQFGYLQNRVIGEAVRHVSKDLRRTYPEIPWQDIAGMRDKLIHDYFGVDIDKVWLTAQEDLPVLKEQIAGIMKDFGLE